VWDGRRVLGGNDPRVSGVAWRAVGRESLGDHGQRRLEEVLGGGRVRGGGGKLCPGRDPREPGVRLAVLVPGLVFVVPGRAMMVVVPVLDGRVVEGDLLRGRMRSA
jgi:hypothetical protein